MRPVAGSRQPVQESRPYKIASHCLVGVRRGTTLEPEPNYFFS